VGVTWSCFGGRGEAHSESLKMWGTENRDPKETKKNSREKKTGGREVGCCELTVTGGGGACTWVEALQEITGK